MKTTKELRLGNLVTEEVLGVVSVTGIKEFSVWISGKNMTTEGALNNVEYHIDRYNIEPIPLTEEWLLKFGAKKNYPNLVWLPLSNLKAEIHFEIFGDEIVTTIFSDYCDLILDRIKYVHQVQNLYFTLTGEELELKEL
jgi:hypothetical protein